LRQPHMLRCNRRTVVVAEGSGIALVVRQALANSIAPWESFSSQTAPSRLLPFRFRGQAIAVSGPFHAAVRDSNYAGTANHRVRGVGVVARQPAFHFRAGVAPLHTVPPLNHINWMVQSLTRASIFKGIPVVGGPLIDRVPAGAGDFAAIHIERADINRIDRCIGRAIQVVAPLVAAGGMSTMSLVVGSLASTRTRQLAVY